MGKTQSHLKAHTKPALSTQVCVCVWVSWLFMCARDGRSAPIRPFSHRPFDDLPAFIWSSDCDIVATITSGSDAHQRTNMEASIFALCMANAPLKLRTNWAYRMVILILFYAPNSTPRPHKHCVKNVDSKFVALGRNIRLWAVVWYLNKLTSLSYKVINQN